MKHENSEAEIDSGVRRADREAIGALFDQEANGLFHSINSQQHACLTAEDIDEIVSDAFSALLKRVRNGVSDDFNPRWYLQWIANKRVISRIRSTYSPKSALQQTSAYDPSDLVDANNQSPDSRLLTAERICSLDAAMKTLTEREMCAVEWWRNHEPPDWAAFEATTAIPAKTGRKLFTEAKAKLKRALTEPAEQIEMKGGTAHDSRKRQTA